MNSPQPSIEALNGSFAIANVVRFDAGEGGLTRINVTSPLASAAVYLHGAHLTQFQPVGQKPVLFLSRKSAFTSEKAIRGGVPVIFPWFGPRGDGRMHGFARTQPWTVRGVELHPDNSVDIVLTTRDTVETQQIWPFAFESEMRFSIGRELSMSFKVRNRSDQAISFENALHTYYAVSDVTAVAVRGLQGVEYIDKNRAMQRFTETDAELRPSGAMDRVYVNSAHACVIEDGDLSRRICIEKLGSQTTVVWTPWADNIASFEDLEIGDWKRFLCVETANAKDDAVTLQPDESHTTTAVVRVEPMP